MQQFGTIVEHHDVAAAGTQTFAGGEPFRCFGFTISSDTGGNAEVEITNVDGDELFHFRMSARATVVMNIPFYADKGFVVSVATTETHISVIRSQAGG